MDKVAAEPGLESAAFGITVPLDQAAPFLTGFIVEGQAPGDRRAQPQVDFKFASPSYFKTIGHDPAQRSRVHRCRRRQCPAGGDRQPVDGAP